MEKENNADNRHKSTDSRKRYLLVQSLYQQHDIRYEKNAEKSRKDLDEQSFPVLYEHIGYIDREYEIDDLKNIQACVVFTVFSDVEAYLQYRCRNVKNDSAYNNSRYCKS